jgi:hypothetical protein
MNETSGDKWRRRERKRDIVYSKNKNRKREKTLETGY